jgi:hypothetical protein
LFGGWLGLDYFYLGFPIWGLVKLVTLGGLGLWWLFDIVRTGCGPVYAADYRVYHNLPHWVFVLITITLFLAIGFIVSLESYLIHRKKKRAKLTALKESEEAMQSSKAHMISGPRYEYPQGEIPRQFEHGPDFRGYGAVLPPRNLPNAGAPYAYEGFPGA